MHLFAFKPQATEHLERFSEAVMRGPSPLSAGFRELIAAFTSKLNHCPF
jgi:alkylhydroperoxidase family enzyme